MKELRSLFLSMPIGTRIIINSADGHLKTVFGYSGNNPCEWGYVLTDAGDWHPNYSEDL